MSREKSFNECLENIDKKNSEINTIIKVYRDGGINEKSEGLLSELTITVKDHFSIKGHVTTNSVPQLKNQKMNYTSAIVQRLLDEGASIIGKTNMPYMAMDSQTRSPLVRITNKPWNVEHTCGGSSAGAASVASGMSHIDVGSDLAGSLRIPAHFCGVYSIKPTDNMLQNHGMHPMNPNEPNIINSKTDSKRNIAVSGLIGKSLPYLSAAFKVISKRNDINKKGQGKMKIAWMNSWPGLEIEKEYKKLISDFVKKCSDSGMEMVKIDKPPMDLKNVYKTFGAIVSLELSKLPLPLRLLNKIITPKSPKDFTLDNTILFPTKKLHSAYIEMRDNITEQVESFLDDYDLIICPVTISDAPKHMVPKRPNQGLHHPYSIEDFNGVKTEYGRGMAAMTIPFSVSGNPVVTLPIGFTSRELPVGVQVIGKRFSDMDLIDKSIILDKYAR